MKKLLFDRKKLLRAIYLACVTAFMMGRAHAAIIASDDFGGYTPGVTQSSTSSGYSNFTNQGIGFSTAWTTTSAYPGNNTFTIAPGPLSSPSGTLLTSGNTLVGTSSGTYNDTRITRNLSTPEGFGITPGNTLFVSLLLQPNATLGAGAYAGYFQLSVGGGTHQTYMGGQGSGASALWQLAATNFGASEGTSPAKSTTLESAGTPVLLVEEISFIDASTASFSLYINPTPGGSQPGTADAQISSVGYENITSLFFQDSGNFSASDLVLGTTWGDVTALEAVPEPSTYAMLLLGAGLLFGIARYQRKMTLG